MVEFDDAGYESKWNIKDAWDRGMVGDRTNEGRVERQILTTNAGTNTREEKK